MGADKAEDLRNRVNALKARVQKAEYIITDALAELEVIEDELQEADKEKTDQMAV